MSARRARTSRGLSPQAVSGREKRRPTARVELTPESWIGLVLCGLGFKGLVPVLHRSQALESLLELFGVVPVDVVVDCAGELFDGGEAFAVVHLGFQVAEEVLDDGVVPTVTLCATWIGCQRCR